jgi:hypothetical protein
MGQGDISDTSSETPVAVLRFGDGLHSLTRETEMLFRPGLFEGPRRFPEIGV